MKLKLILITTVVVVGCLVGAAVPGQAAPFAYVTNGGGNVSQYAIERTAAFRPEPGDRARGLGAERRGRHS